MQTKENPAAESASTGVTEPKEVPKWEPHMFGLEEEKREEKEGEVQPRQEEDELVVDIRTR